MAEPGTMDYTAHQRSYLRFLGLLKFGIVAVAIITMLVIFAITR